MSRFDRDLRDSQDWQGWEDNKAHKYAIRVGDALYPVKQIVALATGMPVAEFSGGEGSGQANEYVRNRGFEVVPLRQRNPKWTRDELILALDLYLRHRPHLAEKDSSQIQELSNILNRIGTALGVHGDLSFRNNNGVYMKLMNFRRLDPDYTSDGKVGLTRGGKDEEEVWQEFAQNPGHCHQVALAIRAAIEQAAVLPVPVADEHTDDYVEAQEGRLLTALHRHRERSRKIVDRKKAAVLKQRGRLACDVCGFDFERTYGARGAGFIECHHTRPVSESAATMTRLTDLALVCANCHRMIHAARPWLTLADLSALIAAPKRQEG